MCEHVHGACSFLMWMVPWWVQHELCVAIHDTDDSTL